MLGGSPTVSGSRINERTALQVSAVYACVRVIAESIGSLPLHVYKRLDPRGREKATKTREYALLHNAPNERMTSCIFREVMTAHVLLFGNAYALIEFDQSGKTRAIWPLMPSLVVPNLLPDRRLEYIVRDTITNTEKSYPADEIIHIPGLSFDGVSGVSPILYHREGIGLAAALEMFGAEYFGHGTAPSGILSVPSSLNEEQRARLRASWRFSHGIPGTRHGVAILEQGMEFKPIQIQSDHAQFIESRKFQINEICRIFRVPPHLIGDLDRATFTNIEQQSLEFVEYTLRPWLVRWEQELNRKLFPGPSKFTADEFFVEHNIDGLLRGDFASRMTGYASGRQWGYFSVNDIREKENMNPLPDDDGDQYLVPTNMTTPELLANPPEPKPAPIPAPPEALPLEPKPNGNGQSSADKARFKRIFGRPFAETIRRSLNYDRKDPAKLERLVSMSFAPVLAGMAEYKGGDVDVAIHYAGLLHARVAEWAAEMERRSGHDAPMAEILEQELDLAYNFIAEKESHEA
jgi:HK97 family phage portal protein